MFQSTQTSRQKILIFLLAWSLSAVYLGVNLNVGWDPHDEGTLGQSAERVLHGEMPHRDFEDPYTGGLAYIDAAIFKLFGINLPWLRFFLFAFFLAWVPAVFALARQFLSSLPAAGVTLVAVVWSFSNYFAAMPTWFNLFLATFGTLALAKYIRKPSVKWLVLAGFCGGCSFLIKTVALYYIAAALLFFVYREQLLSRNQAAAPRRTPLYLAFLTICLSLFVFSLIKLVFAVGDFPEYLHFVFPGVAIALLLAFAERIPAAVSDWSRLKTLFGMAVPFLLAAALPVALFCVFYWRHNALAALMNGLFVAPFRRLFAARLAPIGLFFEYPSVLAALLLVETAKLRGQPRRVLSIVLVAIAALILFGSRSNELAFIVAIASALGIIPVLVGAALPALVVKPPLQQSEMEAVQQLALLLGVTALFSLIQFPYSSPVSSPGYFGYVSPLAALLAGALLSRLSAGPRILLYAAFAFYLLFPLLVIHPHFMGGHLRPDPDDTVLLLPRVGGLRVTKKSAAQYLELIPFIKSVAGDRPMLAGPDCPEVYFLAGLQNHTPVLYDSLEDPQQYQHDMKSLIDRPDFIKTVVLFEPPVSPTYQLQVLRLLIPSRFPYSRKIGFFTVYWRQ